MRVLHLVGIMSPQFGGSKVLLSICREQRRLGIESHIASIDADLKGQMPVPLEKPVEVDGAVVYYLPSSILRKYGFSWRWRAWLKQQVKSYDILHLHGVFSYVLIAIPYARRYQVPYIIDPSGELGPWCLDQGRLKKRIFLGLVGRDFLNDAAAIHYKSEEEMVNAKRLGFKAPAAIVPLGLDDEDLAPVPYGQFRGKHPELEGKKVVLFLARIDPVKGLDRLIPAAAELARSRDDFWLVIAGDGEARYERRIREMVERSGIAGRTIFTGFVRGAEKSALLRDADVFVLPSYHENFGMAVAEAMGAGLPVVVSKNVNIYREIAAYGAGEMTECEAGEITRALNRLLDDEELRHTMGANGRRLVQEKFRNESVSREMLRLYESILARSAATAR